MVTVGVDTGGTFTDLVALDRASGELTITKTLTTKPDPSAGVFRAIGKALRDPSVIDTLVHATTVATNTLIERDGARTALFITVGFRDILKIQRVVRKHHLSLEWNKPAHLAPRNLCFDIQERMNSDGEVIDPLNEDGLRLATQQAVAEGIEAVAIVFLYSYLNDSHEVRARELVHDVAPDLEISLSSEVFPLWREYERASTTVIDAYLKPRTRAYTGELNRECHQQGVGRLLFMQSNGGSVTPGAAGQKPVGLVRSGPAGGATATRLLGNLTGLRDLIIADMGGTSFDAGLIRDSEVTLVSKTELEWGIPICAPMIDVRSIGAGGGSEIWVDDAGLLRVGPRSVGSVPGPVCYQRGGTRPAITDANLVVGRIPPASLMAGELSLDRESAHQALTELGAPLGLSAEEAAAGAITIVNHNMANLIRALTVDRGLDPRDFALVAFGGAGPLHGVEVARELGVGRVVIPVFPGAFSALGALLEETRFDFMMTSVMASPSLAMHQVQARFERLEARARHQVAAEGITTAPVLRRFVDMRYLGQGWEVEVPFPSGRVGDEQLATAFDVFCQTHDKQFGWSLPDAPFELVTFKVVATVPAEPVRLPRLSGEGEPIAIEEVDTYVRGRGTERASVFDRRELTRAAVLPGPAIVAEMDSTTYVPDGADLSVDEWGNLHINVGSPQ